MRCRLKFQRVSNILFYKSFDEISSVFNSLLWIVMHNYCEYIISVYAHAAH